MNSKLSISSIFFLILFFFNTYAFSQNNYNSIKIVGLGNLNELNFTKNSKKLLSFKTRIPGVGTINFAFDKQKNISSNYKVIENNETKFKANNIIFFEGKAIVNNLVLKTHGSLKDQELKVSFIDNKLNKVLNHYFEINIENNTSSANFRRFTLNKNYVGTCLSKDSEPKDSDPKDSELSYPNVRSLGEPNLREVEIGLIGDKFWSDTYEENSASEMLRIVSEVDTLYSEQLKVKFKITEQIIYTDKFFGTLKEEKIDSLDMLTNFREFSNKESFRENADIFHLFSNIKTTSIEDPTANVIGLAYTSVVCRAKNFSYGYTTHSSFPLSLVPTFAHELGHNFGASHSDSGLMMASLDANNIQNEFSNLSLVEINNYINSNNFCLNDIGQGGESSSDNGGNSSDQEINLSSNIKRNGRITINIEIPETFPECSLILRAGTRKARNSYANVIFTENAYLKNTPLTARYRINALGKNTRNNKRIRYFLTAQLSCPAGSLGESKTIRIAPNKIISKRTRSAKRWIRGLGNKLSLNL